jgi:hypothetical protein
MADTPDSSLLARVETAEWLAFRARPGGGSTSGSATFVYRPGGTAHNNVYTDWPSLYAAFSNVQGPRWVWIDGSLGTPLVPAGAYNVDNAIFGTYGNGFPAFAGGTLTFADGAVFSFTTLVLTGNLTFQSASSTPCCQMVEGGTLYLDWEAEVNGGPLAPWANVPNGVTCACVVLNDAELGEGVNAAISVQSTGSLTVFAWNRAYITANCVSTPGASGVVAIIYTDATTQLTFTFTSHVGHILQDSALFVQYTTAAPGNWTSVPGVVSIALDVLAAPNTSSALNAAPIGPVGVAKLNLSFTKEKNGKIFVSGTISGTDTVAEEVVITLEKDNVTIGGQLAIATSASAGVNFFGGSISWIDMAADGAAHTYSIVATGTSLTVAAHQAILNIMED